MIKKFLYAAAMIALLTACGSDDPIAELPVIPTEKPSVSPDVNGEKPEVEKDTITEPKLTDLQIYFNLNNSLTVDQAIKYITETRDEKDINGVILRITETKVETRNDEEGKCTILFTGIINKKEFTKQFSFEGLSKKPEKYFMAKRGNMKWKEEFRSNPEKCPIAFDELYRLKKTDKFTAKYLSQWVDFYATNPEGTSYYVFSEEDIAKTEITNISYNDGLISLTINYDGITGKTNYKEQPSLKFNKDAYYQQKVTLNRNNTKQYYMQGFYEYLESFYGNAIQVEDEETFLVELVRDSKTYDRGDNSVRCHFSLSTFTNPDVELARFEFRFDGFKPLTDLKKEWFLATRSELNEYMSKKLANAPDGDVMQQMKRMPVSNWIKLTQMGVRRDGGALELYCDKIRLNNIDVDAWIPVSRRVIHSDILLAGPHFEVRAAEKKGKLLTIQVALIYVNETSLKDVVVPLEVML